MVDAEDKLTPYERLLQPYTYTLPTFLLQPPEAGKRFSLSGLAGRRSILVNGWCLPTKPSGRYWSDELHPLSAYTQLDTLGGAVCLLTGGIEGRRLGGSSSWGCGDAEVPKSDPTPRFGGTSTPPEARGAAAYAALRREKARRTGALRRMTALERHMVRKVIAQVQAEPASPVEAIAPPLCIPSSHSESAAMPKRP